MKKSVCRLSCLLLCLALLWALIPGVSAQDAVQELYEILERSYEELEVTDSLELKVDISHLELYEEQVRRAILYRGRTDVPFRPWYLQNIKYGYFTESGLAKNIVLTRVDPAQYDYRLYEQKVAELLDRAVQEGMSQWQMALSIHDQLVVACAYDSTLTYRDGYDALVRGTTVCSGYTEVYLDLLHRVGIRSIYVSSEPMDHAWNLVQLDGVWYHVDATWDDPLSSGQDTYGRCSHNYFLISDQAIADEEHEHHGWEADTACTETGLDEGRFWHGIDSPICYESAAVCYYRARKGDTGHAIYRREADGTTTELVSVDSGYVDIGAADGKRWFRNTFGLTLQEGKLYFADMTAVYRVNTDGTQLEKIYSHDCKGNKSSISGCHVQGNTVYLTVNTQGVLSSLQLTVPGQVHVHTYTARQSASTCSEKGYTEYTCSCGLSYQAQRVASLPHDFEAGAVLLEPTVFGPGSQQYVCRDCGYTESRELPTLPIISDEDDGEVSEEEYTLRRIIVAAVVVLILFLIFRRKKR